MLVRRCSRSYLALRWFAFVFAAVLAVAPGVQAQAKPVESPQYRPLIEEAIREYDARHFEEARALFTRAVAVYPSARAYRGIGMCEFELRNYGDSAENLQKSLQSDVQPLTGELRAQTEGLLERARSFLATLQVAVEPKQAVVIVDGTPLALGPNGDLVLEVGDHVLEFRAEGYEPAKQRRKVRGGEREEVRVLLTPERAAAVLPPVRDPAPTPVVQVTTAPQPSERRDDERRPVYKNPWLWTGVGVAVAAVAVGLAIGLRKDDSGSAGAITSQPGASINLN